MRFIHYCTLVTLTLLVTTARAIAQPDLAPAVPSLMDWLSDPSPRARQFREQLNIRGRFNAVSTSKASNVPAVAPLAASQSSASNLTASNSITSESTPLFPHLVLPRQLQAPLPPDKENAALDYLRLHKILREDNPLDEFGLMSASLLAKGSAVTKGQEWEARELLATRSDVMEIVYSAAHKQHCVFQRDWNKGPELELPEYYTIRQAAILLCAQQALLLRDGGPFEAIALAREAYRLAEHAASDPLFISYLFGQVCEQMENRQLGEVLRQAGSQEKVVITMRDAVVQSKPRIDVQRALQGEFVMAYAYLESMRWATPKAWAARLQFVAPDQITLSPSQRLNQILPAKFTAEEQGFLEAVINTVQARLRQRYQHYQAVLARKGWKDYAPNHSGSKQETPTHDFQFCKGDDAY